MTVVGAIGLFGGIDGYDYSHGIWIYSVNNQQFHIIQDDDL